AGRHTVPEFAALVKIIREPDMIGSQPTPVPFWRLGICLFHHGTALRRAWQCRNRLNDLAMLGVPSLPGPVIMAS
ncbi:MAG: hypothetical protein WCD30_07370, partial [Pseudolabrys sp.]